MEKAQDQTCRNGGMAINEKKEGKSVAEEEDAGAAALSGVSRRDSPGKRAGAGK